MDVRAGKAPVDDIEIAYWRVGSGIPLVTVGGPHLGHRYMRSLDPWTSEGFELVYYDARGSGNTELGDPDKVTFSGAIEDLDGLRAHLGIDKLNIVGHSLGANLAVIYAAKRPEHTGTLVALNPGPPLAPHLMEVFQKAMGERRSREDDEEKRSIEQSPGFASGDPGTFERYLLNTMSPFFSDHAHRDACELGFTEITAANVGAVGERMFRDLGQLDPIGSLGDISCPTLVVHAENDPLPEEYSRLLADKIASAEYQYLGGVNHFAHFEAPDALAAAVMPFLRTFAS
jgi:pimeloyl-ACP methyl ester carboxylesterase